MERTFTARDRSREPSGSFIESGGVRGSVLERERLRFFDMITGEASGVFVVLLAMIVEDGYMVNTEVSAPGFASRKR